MSRKEHVSLNILLYYFHEMYFFIVFQPLDFTGQTEASHSKCVSVFKDVEWFNIALGL